MNRNLTIAKLVLVITVAVLAISPASSAKKRFHRATLVQTNYLAPIGYTVSQGGIYHNDVLPNGTVTGPIGPEANGG
jgi:hypothetical protein